MIAIYSDQKSPRLNYILTQLFSRILGCDFYLTNKLNEYLLSPLPGIAYCTQDPHKGIWIKSTELLFSKGLSKLEDFSFGKWGNLPTFFHNNKKEEEDENVPFDLFAASFYLLSRMEEYHSNDLDKHGRYKYEASILQKMGCITHPIVDEWVIKLKNILLIKYPDLEFSSRQFRFIPTIDIDHPFLYRNKGVANSLCLLKDLGERKFKRFWNRLLTILRFKEDPYFNFSFIAKLYEEEQIKGLFFAHRGPYGQYDRHYIFPSKRLRKMMRMIDKENRVLLHPSYVAAFNNIHLCHEKMDLERVLNHQVNASRQHYLRIRFPESYRLLQSAGIYHDYSVIYTNQYGFRTGTSIPFPFYDIENERETPLMIHTTAVIDMTLKEDFSMSPEQALETITKLYERVQAVGGDFITLFHNSSLAETDEWKGWRRMYVRLIKNLSNINN